MERTQTLKPGLLVSCATSVRGNVKYSRTDTVPESRKADGTAHAEWHTVKTVRDPEEQARADKVRSEARNEIVRVCSQSSFGLLCPTAQRSTLNEAIDRALYMVREFNKTATTTTVRLSVLCGQIASTDEEAARALNRELVDLIADMQEGIASANPGAIRDAAKRAKAMEGMLTDETAEKVSGAISEARKAARELVKRVEKGAERAADVVAEINTEALKQARMQFLDLDDEGEAETVQAIARGAELDDTPDPTNGEGVRTEAEQLAEDEARAEYEGVMQERAREIEAEAVAEGDPLADIPRASQAALDID